ncbi:MAG TPA: hypothetical protein ENH82_03165 [bacterium]|nr:hypothetical protein [bacterium]
MKERPILFSGKMVRAILEGRKTQTRRVLKHTTEHKGPYSDTYIQHHIKSEGWAKICPYGKVGDQLWVRETFRVCDVAGEAFSPRDILPTNAHVHYRTGPQPGGAGSWKPSIHMPRWASRINLEVTDIRVERVQDISIDDCVKEGVMSISFEGLWDSLNEKRGFGWGVNPWVWVLGFRRVDAE